MSTAEADTDRPIRGRERASPRASAYTVLAAVVLVLNIAYGVWVVYSRDLSPADHAWVPVALRMILVDLAFAVVLRNRLVTDSMYRLAVVFGRGGKALARGFAAASAVYDGLHAGAAVSAAVWFGTMNYSMLTTSSYPPLSLVLNSGLVVFFIMTMVSALSPVRVRVRELFRVLHRFGVWFLVCLLWAQNEIVTVARTPDGPWHERVLDTPEFWLLVLITISLAAPWLGLRRVPVEVVRVSQDVVTVRLKGKQAAHLGAIAMVSRSPFGTYHQFTRVQAGRSGALLLMSRRATWVSDLVDFPCSHLWVHASPRLSRAYLGQMYPSAVFVATGTAIAEPLARIARGGTLTEVLWVVRDPWNSYGTAFMEELRRSAPNVVIIDVDEQPGADVLEIVRKMVECSGVEAVGIAANRRIDLEVRAGLNDCGVPTFGS